MVDGQMVFWSRSRRSSSFAWGTLMVNGLMAAMAGSPFAMHSTKTTLPGLEQNRQSTGGAKDGSRRQPHQPLERPREMGLIGKSEIVRDVDARLPAREQGDGAPGPQDLLQAFRRDAEDVAETPLHRALRDRPTVALHHARHDVVTREQPAPDEAVDQPLGVL